MPDVSVMLELLVVVALLALVARRLKVPYPIILVVGGLAIGMVPGLPRVTLAPDLVFFVFLPPLVYAGGWFTSLRDLKANIPAIGLLAVGLVLFTIACVAASPHLLFPTLPSPVPFPLAPPVPPPH